MWLLQAREVTRTDQQLERDLANMGLRIENVEGDGNCMFRAVAAQLRVSTLPAYSKSALRTFLCADPSTDATQTLRIPGLHDSVLN